MNNNHFLHPSNITSHENMTLNNFTDSFPPWAQTYRNPNQVPRSANSLNPSVSSFQPNVMDLQRYQPPQPSSLQDHRPMAGMEQLQNYVLSNHFTQVKDMASLERKTSRASHDVAIVQKSVSNDIRTLEKRIEQLQNLVQGQQDANR
jgi:hypothetical protein